MMNKSVGDSVHDRFLTLTYEFFLLSTLFQIKAVSNRQFLNECQFLHALYKFNKDQTPIEVAHLS